MNIDLLKDSPTMRRYIDSLFVDGLYILNKIHSKYSTRESIRHTNQNSQLTESKTIIDHVITDCINYSFKISYTDTSLSDHKQIVICFDNHKSNNFINANKVITTTKLNSRSYCDDIKRVLATSNFSSFDDLTTALNQCKNRHLQTVSHTHTVNPYKPWLDDKFFSLLNERNRYYQLKKKSPTNGYFMDKYIYKYVR